MDIRTRRIARSLAALAVPLLLGACASTARFEHMMGSYVGRPIADVQQIFGYNYIERKLPGERNAYTWTWVERGVIPGFETPTTVQSSRLGDTRQTTVIPGSYFPPQYYESLCEFTFIAGGNGKVVSWRAQGNGCGAYDGPGEVLGPGARDR